MNRIELEKELSALGLQRDDIVLVHSSMLSLGPVEGGAETVIDAFMNVLGPDGALIVPVFGKLGLFTELIRNRADAVVSDIPVGTLAGIGGRARELLSGHWDTETAHGEGTPFLKIAAAGGYVCLIGVDQDRNTMLHSAEALLRLPYMGSCTRTCKSPTGEEVTRTWPFYPGPHRNFIGLDSFMRERGIMDTKTIGNAQVRLIRAQEMLDMAVELGHLNPAFVLCDNPACADCVRQRAAIFADRIKHESFTLSASSKLCGRYVPEMVEHLQAVGIQWIELDYVQGKACAFMSPERLSAITAELKAGGINVSALRAPVVPDSIGNFIAALTAAGISHVILPLTEACAALPAFAEANITVSFANVRETSAEAARLLATCENAGFTMSPTAFVRAGEMPFLQSWRIGRFIKRTTSLDIADALWDGTPTALAQGNAEIKELISIIRCRTFKGVFTLGGGAAYPGSLKDAVRDFTDLLDCM